MEKLPKYASELIVWLDENIEQITFEGCGPEAWAQMNQETVRRFAFWAGQRSLVDALKMMLDEDAENAQGQSDRGSVLPVVLGPDGKLRRDASSVHMAPDTADAESGSDDGGDREE